MTEVEDTSKDRQIILYIPDKTIGRNNKTTKLSCQKMLFPMKLHGATFQTF